MTRVIRKEIAEYRSSRWNIFLSSIQESQGKSNSACWKRLPRIYRPASMPFNKLSVGNKQLTASREITEELFQHYKKSFTLPVADPDDKHETEIEKEYCEILTRVTACEKKGETD